ncbi:hypothetical protein BDZ89DRAFT_982253 [Hymenopellis radicata]|nr:hypothetical protein BDZ89DRAFT_982253 [Hymenopellis radicata]
MSYLHDIPSIQEIHPTLPAVLGSIDLNRRQDEGDNIAPNDVRHAKAVAKALCAIQESGQNAIVTPQVVLDADMRRLTVESAYSTSVYAPANMQQNMVAILAQLQQMNQRFDQMNQNFEAVQATANNGRILSRNSRLQRSVAFSPLEKTRTGSGLQRALGLRPLNIALQLADIIPAPRVGETPPQFQGGLASYTNAEILRMIVFYNDDFGIVLNDSLAMRIDKFRSYLSEF